MQQDWPVLDGERPAVCSTPLLIERARRATERRPTRSLYWRARRAAVQESTAGGGPNADRTVRWGEPVHVGRSAAQMCRASPSA